MEERFDQQTKQSSESVGQSDFPISYSNQYVPAVDVLVIEVTFRGLVMVGAFKVAQTIATTTLITVTIMLTRIINLKEEIEVVVVLGVVAVVVPTTVVLTMVKMLRII